MHRSRIIFSIALLTGVSFASAQVTETASQRYTRAAPDAGGQSVDTQNFGPSIYGDFDDLNDEVLTVGASTGAGTAEQHSMIAPATYDADLSVFASAMPDFFDIVNGYAESHFEVTFSVSSAVDFNIVGNASAFGDVNGETSTAQVEIISLGGGSPSQTLASLTDGNTDFDVDGTLLPGDYKLRANVLAIVSRSFDDTPGNATAAAGFTMTFDTSPMPVLGDMNCSGAVDLDDVAPFVQALLDPAEYDAAFPDCDVNLADMNQDTVRDGTDIQDFVTAVLTI